MDIITNQTEQDILAELKENTKYLKKLYNPE